MHGVGFEPTKHNATALKTVPFDHSGIRALVLCHLGHFIILHTVGFLRCSTTELIGISNVGFAPTTPGLKCMKNLAGCMLVLCLFGQCYNYFYQFS